MRAVGAPCAAPGEENDWHAAQVALIADSHSRLVGTPLLERRADETPGAYARRVYDAPMVVLAHDASDDPVFTYANRTAQRLFERPWEDLVGLPSRLSAEADAREAREALLTRVRTHGYIDDYCGVRVSRSGRRFRIEATTVWNLLDAGGRRVGQAARFAIWHPIGAPAEAPGLDETSKKFFK